MTPRIMKFVDKNCLLNMNFKLWGTISTEADKLKFNQNKQSLGKGRTQGTPTGFVYVWLKVNPNEEPHAGVCYVGKAGKQLEKRWEQHEGGFKQSSSGKNLAVSIKEAIGAGSIIEVWARHSEITEAFGVRVSKCTIEELALITLLEPLWNKLLHIIPGENPEEVGYSEISKA